MEDQNDGKNESVIPNAQTFTAENQPTPEAKKKGWERKREAQKIMDLVLLLSEKTVGELQAMLDDVEKNPFKHTALEHKMLRYIINDKSTLDFLDRHISKAPIEVLNKTVTFNTAGITDEELNQMDSFFGVDPKQEQTNEIDPTVNP